MGDCSRSVDALHGPTAPLTWSLLMRKTFPSISSMVKLSVATDSSDSRWGSAPPENPAVLLVTLPERPL